MLSTAIAAPSRCWRFLIDSTNHGVIATGDLLHNAGSGAAVTMHSTGWPCQLHADLGDSPLPPIPGQTTPLGTYATTALRSANVAPNKSASSPPRDAPETASRSSRTAGLCLSHAIARAKYSNGISTSSCGSPGIKK